MSRSVAGAVAGSTGLPVSALTVPPLRNLLGLVTPTPLGWALIGGSAAAAVAVNRVLSASDRLRPAVSSLRALLPDGRAPVPALPGPAGDVAPAAGDEGRDGPAL